LYRTSEAAFFRGNGVGKPLGALNCGSLISVPRSGSGAFTATDAAGMLARLAPDVDRERTCWAMHPTVLLKLGAQANPNLQLGTWRGRTMLFYLGLPVEVSAELPALGSAGDVLLADWSQYVVGLREISVRFSGLGAGFPNAQTHIRLVMRVDGQPRELAARTLPDATNTVASFVTLAA